MSNMANTSSEGFKMLAVDTTLPSHIVLNMGTQYPSLLLDSRTRMILGRGVGEDSDTFVVDLSLFNAFALGVSRRHALLYGKDQQLFIEDMGSAEGTWLDDRLLIPFKPYPVTGGAVIKLGQLTFKVHVNVKMPAMPQ